MPTIKVNVPYEFYEALIIADTIIHSVNNLFIHGSGNQAEDNKQETLPNNYTTNHANFYRVAAARNMANNNYGASSVVNGIGIHKPRRSAFSAMQMGVGNCGEKADLAYVLCREYFNNTWTVSIVSATSMDHAFVIVAKNIGDIDILENSTPKKTQPIIVVDPWPKQAQALLWEHHFIYDSSLPRAAQNVQQLNTKQGKGAHQINPFRVGQWKNFFSSSRTGAVTQPPTNPMIPSFINKGIYQNGLAPEQHKNNLLAQAPDTLRGAFVGWCIRQYNEQNNTNLQHMNQLPQNVLNYINHNWNNQDHMEEKAISEPQYDHQYGTENDETYDYQPLFIF